MTAHSMVAPWDDRQVADLDESWAGHWACMSVAARAAYLAEWMVVLRVECWVDQKDVQMAAWWAEHWAVWSDQRKAECSVYQKAEQMVSL